MQVAPRTGLRAVGHARGEHQHPTQDWTRWCQMAVRTDFGLDKHFATAIAQWQGTPHALRHEDRTPPYGTAGYFSRGGKSPGHAVIIGQHSHVWSNDINTTGLISLTSIDHIEQKWGYAWEGWTETVNLFRIWGFGPAISADAVAHAQRGDREHPHGSLIKHQLAAAVGGHGMRLGDDHLGEPFGKAIKALQHRLDLKRTGVVGPRLLGWLADHQHAFTARP